MAFEIELKVRLDDCEPVKKRLFSMGKYVRSYKKSDSYWLSAEADSYGVRVRRDHGVDESDVVSETTLVTYKLKEISGGVEINEESEFTVSDTEVFEQLLERLGLKKAIQKEKNGWAWAIRVAQSEVQSAIQPEILAELSMVTGLGWFLELEIICEDNRKQTVADSRKRLFALLKQLEIPADRIESRPYTELLKELGMRKEE